LNIGVAGKFLEVQRIFAEISPNLPEKLQKNDFQKNVFIWVWAPFSHIIARISRILRRRSKILPGFPQILPEF